VIAAVNGAAAGGWLALTAMWNQRFASPEASFTTRFSRRGLVSEHGTSWIPPASSAFAERSTCCGRRVASTRKGPSLDRVDVTEGQRSCWTTP
jgi:enoyl-CoA hydratase/carnithine racemase